MTSHQQLWHQLAQSFKQDIPTTQTLLELLKKEKEALETRDYETFKQGIQRKAELLNQLETNASQRQQHLTEAGIADQDKALALLDQQAPMVASSWRNLASLWQQCQELNEVNDRIAKRTKLVVGQLLDILRGQNGHSHLYDAKGDAKTGNSGREITSA